MQCPITTILLSALVATATVSAQGDILKYKFDSGCQGDVINYATGPQAQGPGTLVTGGTLPTGFSSWEPNGRFGGALTGGSNVSGSSYYNRVESGWLNPVVSGDLTLAFWMRQRNSPGTGLSYIWGGAGSLRMFTNGIANSGLYQREIVTGGAGNPNGRDLELTTDVQSLAAAGWVHIALVVDGTANTATWYIDGQQDSQIVGVGQADINETGEVNVGMHALTSSVSSYDLDDFLLSNRAYSAVEILGLFTETPSGAGTYDSGVTSQCGSTTLDTMNTPAVPSTNFMLNVNTAATGFRSIVIGFSRCDFAGGAFSLPAAGSMLSPLAAGCSVLTSADVLSLDNVGSGSYMETLAIPNDNNLRGLTVYAQAVVLDAPTRTVEMSNGVGIGLGF